MALQPVTRRSVPEDVFEQILAEVLSGEMRPGSRCPVSVALAEVLGVSRPAVREALKRVAAAGLVEVRQGDATTVRDFRRHAGLDLLPRLLVRGEKLDVSVVRSILEARLHNGPKVAELAARRRPDDLMARLEAASATWRPTPTRRPAAACPGVLGSRRRRRRLHRVPSDVQHVALRLRTGAAGAGHHDGRRSRQHRGLPHPGPGRRAPATRRRPRPRPVIFSNRPPRR